MSRRLSDLYLDGRNRIRELTVALTSVNRAQADFWQLVMMRDARLKNHTWRARRSVQAIPLTEGQGEQQSWTITLTHDYATIGGQRGAGRDGYPNYSRRRGAQPA